ncbi:unnamed protein product [Acanthoscelides obtectus]|uniref:Carboxylic ester hydrolase n=1 Tax=Acanthoscelides obtectus TaxID=200917 RepID=A0A9P0KIZ4_ACAOB|nr:unnamed protein product [Acanthoscelides obtectus]CAK1660530.1 hypothetical protein AOBTE_LOCUS22132 [Acanthoscelides obtectus]
MTYLILFLVLCLGGNILAEDVLVQLPLGTVKGLTRSTAKGTTFYSFQGIPYAEKPIGDLRFQVPVSKSSWNGTWDASKEGSICNQMNNERPNQSEDCLFINVFTPKINANLPVLFFIYGGGFIEGASLEAYYGPHFLMEEGVVLVTFNYRVGPYGFLSTGDDLVPGNAGLKDQVLALKWVNQYIKYFGGDPSKVTIFGQSAGGASCAYHIMSPLSKGLFRAAILLSGTSLSPWAYQRNPQKWSRNLINLMDNENYEKYNTSQKIYEYLKQAPAEFINKASLKVQEQDQYKYLQLFQGFFFAPVYEHEHDGAFITKPTYEALDQGDFTKIPILLGATSEEYYFYLDDKENLNHIIERLTESYDSVPDDMHALDENKDKIKAEIMKFHTFGAKYADNSRGVVKLMSDFDVKSALKYAELLVKHLQNPYLYQFSYKGVLAAQTNQSEKGFSDTVGHVEDLSYIFSQNYPGVNTTDLTKYPKDDQLIQKIFTTMLTNFAKYLNPTPEKDDVLQNTIWPKTDSDFTYLDIGSDMEIKTHMKSDMYNFWNKLYAQYAVRPFDTY